nr:MAG TPA: hypothetical protein [Caudoviricetes sp.]
MLSLPVLAKPNGFTPTVPDADTLSSIYLSFVPQIVIVSPAGLHPSGSWNRSVYCQASNVVLEAMFTVTTPAFLYAEPDPRSISSVWDKECYL